MLVPLGAAVEHPELVDSISQTGPRLTSIEENNLTIPSDEAESALKKCSELPHRSSNMFTCGLKLPYKLRK